MLPILDKLLGHDLKQVALLIEHNGIITTRNGVDEGKTLLCKDLRWIKGERCYYLKKGFRLRPVYIVSMDEGTTITLNPGHGFKITPSYLNQLINENFKQSIGVLLEESRKIPKTVIILSMLAGIALFFVLKMALAAMGIYVP